MSKTIDTQELDLESRVQAITEARRQGATVLCLPELCITGYGCEDAFHSPSVHRSVTAACALDSRSASL